jgi:hypothetical protein
VVLKTRELAVAIPKALHLARTSIGTTPAA